MQTTKHVSHVSNEVLRHVLRAASEEERLALTNVLNGSVSSPLSAEAIQAEICKAGGHVVFNKIRGEGVPYSELLNDAARSLKVKGVQSIYSKGPYGMSFIDLDRLSSAASASLTSADRLEAVNNYVDGLERQILSQVMVRVYEKAGPEQRAKIDALIATLATKPEGKSLAGLSTTAALLVAGNLGGFATYALMSTVLSALSMGTLVFGAYTFASSLLSVLLGPVGWIGVAVFGVTKVGGPDKNKVLRLALTCASISQRIREESRANDHKRLKK